MSRVVNEFFGFIGGGERTNVESLSFKRFAIHTFDSSLSSSDRKKKSSNYHFRQQQNTHVHNLSQLYRLLEYQIWPVENWWSRLRKKLFFSADFFPIHSHGKGLWLFLKEIIAIRCTYFVRAQQSHRAIISRWCRLRLTMRIIQSVWNSAWRSEEFTSVENTSNRDDDDVWQFNCLIISILLIYCSIFEFNCHRDDRLSVLIMCHRLAQNGIFHSTIDDEFHSQKKRAFIHIPRPIVV